MKRARPIAFLALLSCLHAPHAAIGTDRDICTSALESPPFLPQQSQGQAEQPSIFSRLPIALFPEIGSYLGWSDIAQIASVNRTLRRYVQFHLGTRTVLNLSGKSIGDAWLTQALSILSSLTSLRLRQCVNLTNQGIQQLSLSHPGLTALDLSDIAITDREIGPLTNLTSLHSFNTQIAGAEITDGDLSFLIPLTHLTDLHLSKVQITDAGVAYLNTLTKLTYLHVGDPQMTDTRCAQICQITRLTGLGLWHSQITDEGLVHLSALTKLTHLSLHQTQITDAGLSHLSQLTNLNSLLLDQTAITNGGLVHLRPLKNLAELSLLVTQITDEGLVHLYALTNLVSLYLPRHWLRGGIPGVTDQGRETLRRHMPMCT
jgi:Leucine-rich repeat (LRR) protein